MIFSFLDLSSFLGLSPNTPPPPGTLLLGRPMPFHAFECFNGAMDRAKRARGSGG
jgi:hypothetical protein